jgi:chromosome segregation ATPase
MDQADVLQRLDAALSELEGHLVQLLTDDGDGEASIPVLKEQNRYLIEERDQLHDDLEAERARIRRLKSAHDEVSGRLEVVMSNLKDMMPAMPG